ncbi:MAG: hypothetical protein U9N36_02620 [Euryarchaeota archaeon]|nr:hypothetical protein [Euryarchaeota archaeon]
MVFKKLLLIPVVSSTGNTFTDCVFIASTQIISTIILKCNDETGLTTYQALTGFQSEFCPDSQIAGINQGIE